MDDSDDNEDENNDVIQETLKAAKENRKKKKQKVEVSDVLYIGHLPTHMEETELAGFLKQFGTILMLRVSRSPKTGKSRGYAFCQMKSADVAAIVADTLSGYIVMGQKRLVCHIVPPEKVRPGLFNVSKKAQQQLVLATSKDQQPQTKSLGKLTETTSRLLQRERKKRDAMKAMGIDYEFPGYEASNQQMHQKEPESLNKKGKKRKDSITSADKEKSENKKRKDSIASVNTPVKSDTPKSNKKRKDSITSVDVKESAQPESSKSKKRKDRKDSIESVSSVKSDSSKSKKDKEPAAQATPKKDKEPAAQATPPSSKTAKPAASTQKKKGKAKNKNRRQSAE
jgi:nucleolar protein 15